MKPKTRRYRRRKKNTTTDPFFQKDGQEVNAFDSPKPFFDIANQVQAKLTIGKSNDPLEHQADTMADKMVNQNTSVQRMGEEEAQTKSIQRMEEEEVQEKPIQRKEEEEETLQAKRIQKQEEEESLQVKSNQHTPVAPKMVEQKIKSKKGQGQQLPNQTLHEMNQSFGVDFSGISIHTDTEAQQMSQQIRAQAFTHGKDVYFNTGKFNLATKEGKHLLAHELTHTLQQKGDSIKKLDDSKVSTPIPKGAKKVKNKSIYKVTINGLKVEIHPDAFVKGEEGGETKISFRPKKWNYKGYNTDSDGIVTKVKSPPKTPTLIIKTIYGLKVDPSLDSAYGRGTTDADKKAKTTSLRFHEGNHGLDFIKYVTDHPYPKFPKGKGMKEADFLKAVDVFSAERAAYGPAMDAFSKERTDCVGVTIDEFHKNNAKPGESFPIVCK